MSVIHGNGDIETLYLRQSNDDVQYSNDELSWITITWPATVINDGASVLPVLLTTDLTLSTNNSYFICGSSNIQFGSRSLNEGGIRPIITITDTANNYPGLIQNGTAGANGNAYIYILNLHIHSDGAVIATTAGWIGQAYFSKGCECIITNCSSDGDILESGGGICGNSSGSNGGNLSIFGCSSSGAISGSGAGGILGGYAGAKGGNIFVSQSFTSGDIHSGGGIVGNFAAISNGNIVITLCYTTGNIGAGAGGLCGRFAGSTLGANGRVIIQFSYSTGSIGPNAGGIFGSDAIYIQCVNCYTTGSIAPNGGGIVGDNYNPTETEVGNCYTTGTCAGGFGGIYSGSAISNLAGSLKNFSEAINGTNNGWNSENAQKILHVSPSISPYWVKITANTPYKLINIGYVPYTLDNINDEYKLNSFYDNPNFQTTVKAGSSTPPSVLTGQTYSIVLINNQPPDTFPTISIDSKTGAISTTTNTVPNPYDIIVYSAINPYMTTHITLFVDEAPPPVTITSVSCFFPANTNNKKYTNGLVTKAAQNSNTKFTNYSEYMKYRIIPTKSNKK